MENPPPRPQHTSAAAHAPSSFSRGFRVLSHQPGGRLTPAYFATLVFFQFFDDGGGTDMQHARSIPNATGVHRHVDDLLLDLGGVTGVAVLQQESAPVAYRLLATRALLALAGLTVSDDIGPLAVGAMQDLHNHAITRLAWGLLCVSYTPRE